MEQFNTELILRIDWSEMDLFGHVNNVSFFKYIQAARVNYWELIGLTALHRSAGIGPSLASVQCKFIRPLHYPGTLTIRTRTGWIKNTSFQLIHRLYNDAGEPVAEAEDIAVVFDYIKGGKAPIPESILKAIERHEGEKLR